MYNRYIGNTGQFYRVEDEVQAPKLPPESDPLPNWVPPLPPSEWEQAPPSSIAPEPEWIPPPPLQQELPLEPAPPQWEEPPPTLPPPPEKQKFDIGSMLNMPGSLRGRLQGWMPESLDLGDILLILVLIYLFLEGGDDDMLIILAVLAVTWILPLFRKEEETDLI
ncbi:MAG: hypothetical protein FWD84_02735 [Oscillospiraceae bacterium]|nr:hypothetical protein [Oscillospiraceae bacterium]